MPGSVTALLLLAFDYTPVTLNKSPILILINATQHSLHGPPNAFPRGPSSVCSSKLFTPSSVCLSKLSSQAHLLRVTSMVEVGTSK